MSKMRGEILVLIKTKCFNKARVFPLSDLPFTMILIFPCVLQNFMLVNKLKIFGIKEGYLTSLLIKLEFRVFEFITGYDVLQ